MFSIVARQARNAANTGMQGEVQVSRRSKRSIFRRAPQRISKQWVCYCTKLHALPWSNDIDRVVCYYETKDGTRCPGKRVCAEVADVAGVNVSDDGACDITVKREEAGFSNAPRASASESNSPKHTNKAKNQSNQYGSDHEHTDFDFMSTIFMLQDPFWQCDCNFVNTSFQDWLSCKNCSQLRIHGAVSLIHDACLIINPEFDDPKTDKNTENFAKEIVQTAWFSPRIARILAFQCRDNCTWGYAGKQNQKRNITLAVQWLERIIKHFHETYESPHEEIIEVLDMNKCDYIACETELKKRSDENQMPETLVVPNTWEQTCDAISRQTEGSNTIEYDSMGSYEMISVECLICLEEISDGFTEHYNNYCIMRCGHKNVCSSCVNILKATGETCPECVLGIAPPKRMQM